MSEKTVFTRREFMRSAAIVSAGVTLPFFLTRSIARADPSGQKGRLAIPGFKDDRVLVVVQLGGGNDSLNTIVPFSNDAYQRVRRRIAVPKDKLLKATDDLAFHSGLVDLKSLFDDAKVAVVNGVGYPNPDRSHFRSMEIWHTASDSNRYETTGWIGRYFDNCCSGRPETVAGVNVGDTLPQAFDGTDLGVSFQDPERFRWTEGPGGDGEANFRKLNKVHDAPDDHDDEPETIEFLRHTTANVALSSDKVLATARRNRNRARYPNNRLARDLQTVADLIVGQLPTRLYYVSQSGYDTHANQAGTHERLLGQLGGSLKAFYQDLKQAGQADRVLIMTFSEFGRRVAENASGGTDHGTAGSMFLIGDAVEPGLHGAYPSLTDLDQGDLKFTTDFRSVYGTVVQNWFGADQKMVLGRSFPTLGVLKKT